MNRWPDRQMDRRLDGWMDGQTDGQTDGGVNKIPIAFFFKSLGIITPVEQ